MGSANRRTGNRETASFDQSPALTLLGGLGGFPAFPRIPLLRSSARKVIGPAFVCKWERRVDPGLLDDFPPAHWMNLLSGEIPIQNALSCRNSVRARSFPQPLEPGTMFSGCLRVRLRHIYKIFANLCQVEKIR